MGGVICGLSSTKVAKQIKEALNNQESLYAWDHVKCYNLDHSTTPYGVTYPRTTEQVAKLVKIATNAHTISDKIAYPVSRTTKDFPKGLTDLITHEMVEDDAPCVDFGAYPGYVNLEISHAQKAYWRSNLPRLQEVKAKYDTKDVFHNPQSVRPNGRDVPYTLPAFTRGYNTSFFGRLRL